MSSREEQERSWRTNPEAATASGGHLTPDGSAGESWLNPLDAPLPSETEEARRGEWPNASRSASRTDVFPSTESRRPLRGRPPAPESSGRRKPATRRVKRTIKQVDPLTVLKLSAFYWAALLLLWLVIVAVIYSFIESKGIFNAIEEMYKDFALGKPEISLFVVERWAFVVGFIFGVLATLLNVILAFLYNLAANTIGGLEVTFVERDG